jgi:hypothetical protein
LKDYPTWVQNALTDIDKIQEALNKLKAPVLTVQINSQYNGNPLTTASSSAQAPSTSSVPSGRSTGDQSQALLDGSLSTQLSNLELALGRGGDQGNRTSTNVNVTVQGNVISNKDLADTIRMQLLDSSASGSFTMSNRATRGD